MNQPDNESRMDRIERLLGETAEEFDQRHRAAMAEIEAQRVNIESLHCNIHELFEASQRRDKQIDALLKASQQDGEISAHWPVSPRLTSADLRIWREEASSRTAHE